MVLVPVLDACFAAVGVPSAERMHLAVGTSMSCIVPTALISARRHWQRSAVDLTLGTRWGPACALGAVVGSGIAMHLDGRWLAGIFGTLACLAGIHGLWSRASRSGLQQFSGWGAPPRGVWWSLPVGIGSVSAMMGIGGGTFSVPLLRAMGYKVHDAVGTSAWLGAWIALPAALAYLLVRAPTSHAAGYTLGHVNLLALALLVPVTMWLAPKGVALAHALPPRKLGLAFGAFLLLAGGRMLHQAFG